MRKDQEYLTNLILPRKLYDDIEEKVVSLYRRYKVKAVPLEPFDIAKVSGYIVRPYSNLNTKAYEMLKSKEQNGTSYFDPKQKTYVICYDDKQCAERQRFTIMHEFGHIDMGHTHGSQLAETIANHYAGYALAPSPLIQKFNCEDFSDISAVFRISEECAYWRFNSYQNWVKYRIKKKYEKELLNYFND